MKCLAMRTSGAEGSQDIGDIKLLGHALGIRNADDAIEVVSKFYPDNRISPKAKFGLIEIFGVLVAKDAR